MLSKGVRNLLSLQKRFIPLGSSSWIVKPQYGLFNNKNNKNNSDEQNDNANTPEGDILIWIIAIKDLVIEPNRHCVVWLFESVYF